MVALTPEGVRRGRFGKVGKELGVVVANFDLLCSVSRWNTGYASNVFFVEFLSFLFSVPDFSPAEAKAVLTHIRCL